MKPLVVVVFSSAHEASRKARIRAGATRLSHALEQGRPSYALLTGTRESMILGFQDMLGLGAPAEFIRKTTEGDNTIEQVLFVAAHTRIAVERDADIEIVTSAWHLPRATWLFEKAVGRPPDDSITVEDDDPLAKQERRSMMDLILLERMLQRATKTRTRKDIPRAREGGGATRRR